MVRQRRMKGEGSITKLPSGKYRVRLETEPSPLGKRKWLNAVVATQKEATEKLQEFQQTKRHEDMVEKTKDSFGDFIEPYIAHKRSEGLLESSLYRLESSLDRASRNFFGRIPVQKITTETLQEMIDQWREKGNKESTIRINYKNIVIYFDWLRQKKIISKNPCDSFVIRRQKAKKHSKLLIISEDEHKRLKEVMEKYWNPKGGNLREQFFALYLLTYETGMRQGEVAGLKIKSVDTETDTITVENSLSSVNGMLIDNPPKTTAGYRDIVITKKTMGYLKGLLEHGDDNDYVFRMRDGSPFKPQTIQHRWKCFLKEAGIDHKLSFHTIRHTNASIMIANGVPTPVVTERLGHSSVAVTYNTYAHALRDSKERNMPLVEA